MALTKVQNTGIADDAITTDKIENSTVLAADLAAGSVTNAKIATGTIGNDKLTNSSITLNGDSLSLGGSATLKHIDWQALTVADGSTQLTAVAGRGYFLDTNTGVIEVVLPSSPSRGDTFVFVDYGGTFATNQLIINTGGQKIDSSTSGTDFKVTTNNSIVELVYVDANKGYLVKLNQAAGSTPSGVMNDAGGYDTQGFMEATGGTVTTSGDYKIHTFTGDGNFVVTTAGGNSAQFPTTVDYLVVAGGGAGGNGVGNTGAGSGGGAGGYRESLASASPTHTASPHTASPLKATTGLNVGNTTQTIPVTVGGGGALCSTNTARGSNGSNSVFSTITSAGGGAGGSGNDASPLTSTGQPGPDRREGLPGGSAGGSRSGSGPSYSSSPLGSPAVAQGNTPPVSPPQGNNGNMTNPPAGGGGGGGATQAGGAATNDGKEKGGVGGAGATSCITGSPVARAGGGGGSGYANTAVTQAPGGAGGGGSGSYCVSVSGGGSSGTANTGGGGGGGKGHPGPNTNVQPGGNGGKGIVVIRYKFQ